MKFWRALLDFLKGFLPAAINSWLAERKRLQAVADSGAAQQRAADTKADDEITAEARGEQRKIDDLPDADADRRLDRWRM